ncbi:MAG: hypothetical protein J6J60_00300 [Clostridia bacterium]|nr:hypothetical protein [Clostridia bacterium]
MNENFKSEERFVETTGREISSKKRKFSVKRCLVLVGMVVIIFWGFNVAFSKPKKQQPEGICIAGIPFTDIIAKVSVETEIYSGTISPQSSKKISVKIAKDGIMKVNYSLGPDEAIIFDRDGLVLESEKQRDDFAVKGYSTARVSYKKDVFSCEEADSIARVLLYNYKTQSMLLVWEDDLIVDQYLPVTAIRNIMEFDIQKIKPVAGSVYDQKRVQVEYRAEKKQSHFCFDDGLAENKVAIIETDNDDFVVISQDYKDKGITEEGFNYYSIQQKIDRILLYDYKNHVIELVYE